MKMPSIQPWALRLARALLVRSLRPAIRRQLAAVFAEADATVPQALAASAAPIVIEGLLVGAINKATGLRPTSAEAQVVGALFDVVAAAVPLERRR
jgi:hypothetical protein